MMIRKTANLVLAGLLLGAGCSKPSAPVEEAADDEGRDYSQVLRNVRERSSQTMNMDRLIEAIAAFEKELGRPPTNLTEVVRYGFIEAIPPSPPGMAFSYDPTSSVLRTVPAVH